MPIVIRSRVVIPQEIADQEEGSKSDMDMTLNEIQLDESTESSINPMEEER
eukprot:c57389_g1_i1 orf=86-238(+)